jgi:hypothetical protein
VRLELRPVTQKEAFAFVRQHHRHHDVPVGDLWRVGCQDEWGSLVGVAIVGRPVSRNLDDGWTVEVTRLCTLGHLDACTLLYGAAARFALGGGKGPYRRILTYVLKSESGLSLEYAGWHRLGETDGGSWDREGRRREDKHPTEPKAKWGRGAWPQLAKEIAA